MENQWESVCVSTKAFISHHSQKVTKVSAKKLKTKSNEFFLYASDIPPKRLKQQYLGLIIFKDSQVIVASNTVVKKDK